jgi:hypothetical protein
MRIRLLGDRPSTVPSLSKPIVALMHEPNNTEAIRQIAVEQHLRRLAEQSLPEFDVAAGSRLHRLTEASRLGHNYFSLVRAGRLS